MGRFLAHSLLAAFYLSSTTTANSYLFARQQASCAANFSKCPQAGLPSNFCCPSTSTCVALANNTTVLCCPAGQDCSIIAPITCDIAKQDAVATPDNTLKTTALTSTLGKCGDKCCPFGYSCNKQNNCQKDANQSLPPPAASPSTSITTSSATPTTSTPTPTPTSANSPSPSSSVATTPLPTATAIPITTQTCPRFPTLSIIIFFFAGLLTGIALSMLGLLIFIKCHSHHTKKALRRASTQSFGNIGGISSPRLQNESAARTDFLRKKEWDGSPSTLGRQQGTIKRVKSLFMRDRTPGNVNKGFEDMPAPPVPMPGPLNIQKLGAQQNTRPVNPVTPPQQRAPSVQDFYGDIMVYTDGETASALRQNSHNKETGLGIGNGNTMAAGGQRKEEAKGGLLPPPKFLGDRGSGETTMSGQTTFGKLIEKSKEEGSTSAASAGKKGHQRTSSGLAGLQKGQPYVYKGSPSYSDTGSRLMKM